LEVIVEILLLPKQQLLLADAEQIAVKWALDLDLSATHSNLLAGVGVPQLSARIRMR